MNKDKRNNIKLLGTLNNSDESGIIANANQIYDANEDKSTQDVSKEHTERIKNLEAKEDAMQTTLENITKTGEASAASNVTYNHSDSKLDATNVQQAVDEISTKTVFDISAYHATDGTLATYDNLEDALGTDGKNIPQSLRKGGMSVKFVQSSDNKYVQYRLMANAFTTNESDWQGVDDEPTAGSDNLVKSGGVWEELTRLDLLPSFNPKNVFTILGKMYSEGKLINGNVFSTPLIELVGVTQIEYNLFLNNTGQVVSFFDANGDYLSSISVTPPQDIGKENHGIIDITNSAYINAKYVAFSHYNGGKNYIKFSPSLADNVKRNRIQIEKLQARVGIDVNFNKKGMAYVDGVLVISPDIYSTELISLYGINKIKYNLHLNNTAQMISFFDENGELLSDISVTAPTAYGQYNEGEIDLTQSAYTNAKYVGFSKYLTSPYVVKFFYDEETLIEKTNKNTKDIDVLSSETNKNTKDIDVLSSEIGQKLDFDLNVIYSNGVPSAHGDVKGTSLIDISNFRYLMYRLRLNNTGQAVSFYDSDKNYLSEISITASETYAQVVTGIIDLTDTAYSNVKYVALCCWNYNDTFYGFLNNEWDVFFRLTTLEKEKEKPFLVGKKFCALGDSITDGDGNSSYSWYDMLLDGYDAVEGSLNFAETGQCLRTMADRCTAENMANIDICFVMGGTNKLSNYRLGTINDEPTPDKWKPNTAYTVGDKVLGGTLEQHGWTTPIYAYLYWYECVTAGTSGNSSDASGFNHTIDSITDDGTVQWKCLGNPSWYSDMKGICRRVWGFNPKIQIIWIVPIKTKNDADVLNPELWARAEKFQAIRDFCNANSIRFIDLQKEFPLNTYTKNAIMADSLHPNGNGYRIIQDIVCSHIE